MSRPCPVCGYGTRTLERKLKWTLVDDSKYVAVGDRAVYTITKANEAYWLEARDRHGLTLLDLPVRGKPCPSLHSAEAVAEQVDKKRPRIGELSGC